MQVRVFQLFHGLAHFDQLVGRDIPQHLNDPAGPADLDSVYFLQLAGPEVYSGRAGGSVSDSRGHVIELIADANPGSNAVAIAASARQFQYKPVIRVGANVLPEFGGLA